MNRQEIIEDLKLRQSAYSTVQNVPIPHSLLAFIIRELEAEKQPSTLSRRDEIASRILNGILSSQTEMRAVGADNLMENYRYNAINEAVALTDQLLKELDKGKAGKTTPNKQCCEKCGGRTVLGSGNWSFEADQEPFESGKEEDLHWSGDVVLNGYICEDCKHVQGIWQE